jgi:hypothetical protein
MTNPTVDLYLQTQAYRWLTDGGGTHGLEPWDDSSLGTSSRHLHVRPGLPDTATQSTTSTLDMTGVAASVVFDNYVSGMLPSLSGIGILEKCRLYDCTSSCDLCDKPL